MCWAMGIGRQSDWPNVELTMGGGANSSSVSWHQINSQAVCDIVAHGELQPLFFAETD